MVKRDSAAAGLDDIEVKVKRVTMRGKSAPSASQQKAQANEVANVLQIDSKTAAKLLAKSGWSTSVAINGFYNNPNASNSASNGTRKALDQIFDKYRTNPKESPNELDIEGTGRLLEDLGIELDNCAALYFFEFTKSPQLGVITRDGFTSGPLVDAGCDTPDKIRRHIYDQLITNNGTLEQYKAVYNHTFTLLIEDRKKAIDLEQAEAFWRILTDSNVGQPWTPKNGTDFLPMWLEFLNSKWQKAVNRDLWRQTLSFMLKAVQDESLSFWTEESSWPSVIDDFVLWVKVEKRGEAMEE